MVRAKFKVEGKDSSGVTLMPVVGGSPENDQFFSATPGGKIRMDVVNAAALEQFEVGKQYYVDFTLAE